MVVKRKMRVDTLVVGSVKKKNRVSLCGTNKYTNLRKKYEYV